MLPDTHTHNPCRRANAVVSGSPSDVSAWADLYPESQFSVGIHPWETTRFASNPEALPPQLQKLGRVATLPQVVAIGETGLDALRGAPLKIQEQILRAHIALSEQLRKPLLLHVVKRYNEILALRRELAPALTQPWIFHGFRGKPQLARQVLVSETAASPVYISLGEHFNADAARAIPSDRLLLETDESTLTIEEIARRVEAARAGRAI